jgi:phosphatidylinositol-3-phosphatase
VRHDLRGLLLVLPLVAACRRAAPSDGSTAVTAGADAVSVIKHVFVIAMENCDVSMIYGNTADAPYINGTLLPRYARSANFHDELPLEIPSEPHYVWLEAGTNAFGDHTFFDDEAPSATNSTGDTNHLTTQIQNAKNGVTWRTYQEGMDASSGACPIYRSGRYAPKHDPFVFFRDVSGNPPSADSPVCVQHHRPYEAFARDLRAGDVASYTFITPDMCHDMHGAGPCSDANVVRLGDDWLSAELPRIIDYANAHAGVIFLEWDEGAATDTMPFIAVGPGVKAGYSSRVRANHGSVLKSIEAILGLPTLPRVADSTTLADLFRAHEYP